MFDDVYGAGVVVAGEGLAPGKVVVVERVLTPSDKGEFDEVRVKVVVWDVRYEGVEEIAAARWPKGKEIGGDLVDATLGRYWVQSVGGRVVVRGGIFELEILGRGIWEKKTRYHREAGAVLVQSGADKVAVSAQDYPGYPTGLIKVSVVEANPSVTTSYVMMGQVDLSGVSEAAEPGRLPLGYPPLPQAPRERWTSLAAPTWQVPSGWILEQRAVDELRDEMGIVVLSAVKDTHTYYRRARP